MYLQMNSSHSGKCPNPKHAAFVCRNSGSSSNGTKKGISWLPTWLFGFCHKQHLADPGCQMHLTCCCPQCVIECQFAAWTPLRTSGGIDCQCLKPSCADTEAFPFPHVPRCLACSAKYHLRSAHTRWGVGWGRPRNATSRQTSEQKHGASATRESRNERWTQRHKQARLFVFCHFYTIPTLFFKGHGWQQGAYWCQWGYSTPFTA